MSAEEIISFCFEKMKSLVLERNFSIR
jgi:hypothetical protein